MYQLNRMDRLMTFNYLSKENINKRNTIKQMKWDNPEMDTAFSNNNNKTIPLVVSIMGEMILQILTLDAAG